jgi:hypothetical protein
MGCAIQCQFPELAEFLVSLRQRQSFDALLTFSLILSDVAPRYAGAAGEED